MAFSSAELTKLSAKVLAANVISSSSVKQWYEASLSNTTVVDANNVWSDMTSLKTLYANNIAEACQIAFDNPNLITAYGYNQDGTFNDATAIRLTPVIGTNGNDWLVCNTFGDLTTRISNIISPTQIPRPNGLPSAAYSCRIFRGLPSLGNEIGTSFGNDGQEVGWFFSASNSLAMFANDVKPAASEVLYAVFFQYVGSTGGGGGSTGSSVLLTDDGNSWRVRNDYPFLRLERRELNSNGDYVWNSYGNFGASVEVDGVRLSRPYSINVDLNADNLNDVDPINLRSAFRVSGTNQDFTYGNSQQQTVIETKRGTELVRADAVRNEAEFENRPLSDLEIVLDSTDTPEAGSFTEYAWVSNINYSQDADFIRFNELAFEVLEASDIQCPVRISVETLDGELIQENLPFSSLNAGIDGGFNLKQGYHFYNINPKYTDVRTAATVTRLQIAKGYKVKLSAGEYSYQDPRDNVVYTQIVPRQKARVEFLNYVNIFDQSNFREEVYKNAGILLDNGVHAYNRDFSEDVYPMVSVCEHNNAYMPVLGNYEDTTYLASGEGGIVALFDDPTTRTMIWTNGDKQRIDNLETPSSFIEASSLEIDLNGVFTKEMDILNWDVVNAQYFLPLLRNETGNNVGYRVSIISTVVDHQFQESQSKYEFADGIVTGDFYIKPTIDAIEPVYTKLRLPRKRFSINRSTPRKIIFQFQEPVKLYGYYDNSTAPARFVPSVKAEVTRVYEEPLVTGDDLEGRVDQIEGDNEWRIATDQNLPTLHLADTLLVLADEDGEWLLWSDIDNLYSDQDIHQWIFTNNSEAYFELTDSQGSYDASNTIYTFDPVVVHIPYDTVTGFEVTFNWHSTFAANASLSYGKFTLYISSGGRGFDSKIQINIPANASLNWRFRRRRDGSYSYIATPMNKGLASVWLGEGNDLSSEMPVDPNPPVEILQ